MIKRLITFGISVTCLLFAGCSEDAAKPCDLWVAQAIVSGQVTDGNSGGPIVNTEVEVSIARGSECDGGEDWVESRRVVTNESGQYSVTLELGNQSGVRCVGAQEVNSGAMARGTVEFVGGCNETGAPGQLTLDVTI